MSLSLKEEMNEMDPDNQVDQSQAETVFGEDSVDLSKQAFVPSSKEVNKAIGKQ